MFSFRSWPEKQAAANSCGLHGVYIRTVPSRKTAVSSERQRHYRPAMYVREICFQRLFSEAVTTLWLLLKMEEKGASVDERTSCKAVSMER